MSKILFVDDEIIKKNGVFADLFKKYLSPEEEIAIRDIHKSGSNRAISINTVKKILEHNQVIEVEDDYCGAIKKIKSIKNADDYDLIILDRNLRSDTNYQLKDVQDIISEYDNEAYTMYNSREGDFLLLLLQLQGVPCQEKVRIYSAYPGNLKSALYLSQMLKTQAFDEKNFFNKDQNDRDKLIKQINEPLKARMVAKYRYAFSGLSKAGCLNKRNDLIEILVKNNIFSDKPRVILEDILCGLEKKQSSFFDTRQRSRLSEYIDSLATILWHPPKTNKKMRQPSPIVPRFIHIHCMTIKNYCSAYLAHSDDFIKEHDNNMLPPTNESWLAVRHALLEILIWLDKVL